MCVSSSKGIPVAEKVCFPCSVEELTSDTLDILLKHFLIYLTDTVSNEIKCASH